MRGPAVADVEDDAALARLAHLGQHAAVAIEDAVGWRRIHVRDDVAGAQQREDRRQRRRRLPDVHHHGELRRHGDLERAADGIEIAGAGHRARQPRLDADDDARMGVDGPPGRRDVGIGEVEQLADGAEAGAAEVEQDADAVRRRLGEPHQPVDVVGAARAGVDHRGDARGQAVRRRHLRTGMDVDVDEAGRHELAPRVEHVGGVARRQVASHGGDTALADAHIGHGVVAARRVDDPTALDQQVEAGGERRWCRRARRPQPAALRAGTAAWTSGLATAALMRSRSSRPITTFQQMSSYCATCCW